MTTTGRFVWYELLTTDPTAAQGFYTEAIGWTTQPFGEAGGYTMFASAQGPLGGSTTLPPEAKAMGAPPYWQANVEVADVDATVAQVKELGGSVYVVETVPTVGKFAVIADPQGAVIAVFTPETPMAAHDTTKHGEFSWHELYTTDVAAALAFYGAIAGWEKLGEHDMGPMGTYVLWGKGGKQLGGMMKKPAEMPGPPGWLYYVTVGDLEGALGRAVTAGAKVLNGPMDVPGGMRIVQLADPQGAMFAFVSAPVVQAPAQ